MVANSKKGIVTPNKKAIAIIINPEEACLLQSFCLGKTAYLPLVHLLSLTLVSGAVWAAGKGNLKALLRWHH